MRQQMSKIGKTANDYHWQEVRISGSAEEAHNGYFEIKAYNERYILVDPEKYYGLFILANNSAFHSDDHRQSGAPEFTDIIRFIRIADKWNFEIIGADGKPLTPIPVVFIRVVIY